MQSRKIFRKSILEDLLNEGDTQEKRKKMESGREN
jgi:hypothetical protein